MTLPYQNENRGSSRQRVEVFEVAGVGQRVEHEHLVVRPRRQHVLDEGAADEPGAAGHQNAHYPPLSSVHQCSVTSPPLGSRKPSLE